MYKTDVLQARKILLFQFVTTLGLGAAAFVFGQDAAVSALIGGGICTLSNALFAVTVFGRYRAQWPELMVARFYSAEIKKIGLALLLFVVTFRFYPGLVIPALLGAYFIVQVLPMVLASKATAAKST